MVVRWRGRLVPESVALRLAVADTHDCVGGDAVRKVLSCILGEWIATCRFGALILEVLLFEFDLCEVRFHTLMTEGHCLLSGSRSGKRRSGRGVSMLLEVIGECRWGLGYWRVVKTRDLTIIYQLLHKEEGSAKWYSTRIQSGCRLEIFVESMP